MDAIQNLVAWSATDPIVKEQKLKQTIAIVGVTLNAKAPEDEDEEIAYQLFISQVSRHYSKITPDEIVQAFELNFVGSEWSTVQFHGRLDFPFFCAVMREFMVYRTRTVKDFNQKLILEVQEQNKPADKPQEQINLEHYDWILNYRKENGAWPLGNYQAAWVHFWHLKGLKRSDVEQWFEEESEKVKTEIINYQLANTLGSSTLDLNAIRQQSTPEAIKAECRRRFFKQWHEKQNEV